LIIIDVIFLYDMYELMVGVIAIPCGGFAIAAIYHCIRTKKFIIDIDTEPVKKIWHKFKHWWYNKRQSRYLTELVQDPETGEIYYFGDGLRRNVATSP
jgi:hypothetical protein